MEEFEMSSESGRSPGKSKLKLPGVILLVLIILGSEIVAYLYGRNNSRKIAVDFSLTEEVTEIDWKYKFLAKSISDYIYELSNSASVDPNLAVAILMAENPEFNKDAVHRNDNGTMDVGLFQLNDRYVWTTFISNYWFDNVDLDPFNWKHNTYLAIHHIQYLQSQLKVEDDIIMAYNCGIGAVMNNRIPDSTKIYLAKVKNNKTLLELNNQAE